MDPLAIARRLEAIQAEVVRGLASDSEAVAGGWMAANGPGSYLNKAVALGFEGEPTDEDVARVERFFASRGIEPRVELTQFAPVPFLRRLAEARFVVQEFENTLVLPLRGLGDPRVLLPGGWPAGVHIERVDPRDDGQVDIFVRTSASGFIPGGEEISEEFLRTGTRSARAPEHDSYVAYVGVGVAGAGGGGTRAGVTSLFGTSVLPRFRRRGVQQALMAVRLERALEFGSDLADITSHPGIPTERNAARLGFRLAHVRAVLVKRGADLVPSP
ncbi:MAG: GNAT family N-acetyltransferase [Myxococcaceae bacterium]|nr:MAG: GNAT family N-acetyltransferase [Myxococcaceae bacterium]